MFFLPLYTIELVVVQNFPNVLNSDDTDINLPMYTKSHHDGHARRVCG
jgi:hypothetical protein